MSQTHRTTFALSIELYWSLLARTMAGLEQARDRKMEVRMFTNLSRLARLSLLGAWALLSVVAAAQQPAAGVSPRIALQGYDPVAYFTEKRPVRGVRAHSFDFDGTRYLFSSDKNRALFATNPDRFAPQFAAHCTGGIAAGMKVEADPNQWNIVDGKLYVFSSAAALAKAKGDPRILGAAQTNWPRLR